jgi:hypothetical protein
LDFRPDLDSCLLALPRLEIVGAFIALVRPAKPCQPAATLLANRKAWIDRQWTVQHQGSRVSLLALAGIRAVGTPDGGATARRPAPKAEKPRFSAAIARRVCATISPGSDHNRLIR